MSSDFDPYYKWLGIPPKDQPPHLYRLLGIECFEPDDEVIDAAANRVMGYLQNLSVGDRAEESQKLLNEIAAARLCLLDTNRKADYDAQLQKKPPASAPAQKIPPAVPDKPQRPIPNVQKSGAQVAPATTTAPPSRIPIIQQEPVVNVAETVATTAPSGEPRRKRKSNKNVLMVVALGILFMGLVGSAYYVLSGDDDDAKRADSKSGNSSDKKRKKPKQPKKQLPPLSEFDPTKQQPDPFEELPQELPAKTREAFAAWIREAETAMRANRPAKGREILERYVRYGDAPERRRAENLLQQCRYADIGLEEAAQFLSQMSAADLRALERGVLEISINDFEFTHPNLRQAFYNRLRRHYATISRRD